MPKVSKSKMGAFLAEIKQDGVKTVYADPKNIAGSKMDALWTTKEAKYVIIKNNATKYKNKKIGKEFQVRSNEDIEDILQQAKKGLDFVIIEVKDWKIIPLENIIAKLHKLHTRIFAIAKNPAEVRKMFSILDVGVDGVIFAASSASQVREVLLYMGTKSFDMQKATITEIKEVGDGERVCVDTASMLHRGEIGSRSNFMFLVHYSLSITYFASFVVHSASIFEPAIFLGSAYTVFTPSCFISAKNAPIFDFDTLGTMMSSFILVQPFFSLSYSTVSKYNIS